MRRRHPLPRVWLMTDPRLGDLEAVVSDLPKWAGIIFRHYELPRTERRALFNRVMRVAKAQRHIVLLADRPGIARQWGADGAHHRSAHRSHGIRTVAVHNPREAVLARRVKADLIFVSPVFATRSHPGQRATGVLGMARIARDQLNRTIALGGMTAKQMRRLRHIGIYGWAGIDGFSICL